VFGLLPPSDSADTRKSCDLTATTVIYYVRYLTDNNLVLLYFKLSRKHEK
jgi:hypothetical protein